MSLVEAIELLESPLMEAILLARDFNDGAAQQLAIAAGAVQVALELARDQARWNAQELRPW